MCRALLLMTCVMTLLGSALAQGGDGPSNSLTCSFGLPLAVLCFYERTVFSLGNIEIAAGAEAGVQDDQFYLAPFVVAGYYSDTWFVVGELRVPEGIVPVIGSPGTAFRVISGIRW